jgi:SAM-dependent methyltransferase
MLTTYHISRRGSEMMLTPDSPDRGEETLMEKGARSRWGSYIAEVEERVLLKANDLVRGPTTALEVGCEGGRWLKLLVDLEWDVVGTDVDPHTLAVCQKRIPTAKCILVDANDTTLPCETESLGLLLCIEVPPVIQSEWFITEAWRVLHHGGLVVGVFENLISFRGYYRHLVASARGQFDYYKVSYPSWRDRFCRQGFKMIYEEGICWFPFTRTSNSPLVPVFTQIERYLGLHRLPSVSPWIVFLAQKELPVDLESRQVVSLEEL